VLCLAKRKANETSFCNGSSQCHLACVWERMSQWECALYAENHSNMCLCVYTLEWTEFWCVCVLAVRCQEQNRCVIRSSRSAKAWCVCVCLCEYFSSGCWSVSAKCHEGQESSYITLLNHIHHPVAHKLSHTRTLTWYRQHIQWGLNVWDSKSNLNLKINKVLGLWSNWN